VVGDSGPWSRKLFTRKSSPVARASSLISRRRSPDRQRRGNSVSSYRDLHRLQTGLGATSI
jgi:hypothetical protein